MTDTLPQQQPQVGGEPTEVKNENEAKQADKEVLCKNLI
jgi:hypothetical protein